MLIELRCVTPGGAREEVVPGNLNSEPSRVNSIWLSQYFRAQSNSFPRLLESKVQMSSNFYGTDVRLETTCWGKGSRAGFGHIPKHAWASLTLGFSHL